MKTTWLWIAAPLIVLNSACSDSNSDNANPVDGAMGNVESSEPDTSGTATDGGVTPSNEGTGTEEPGTVTTSGDVSTFGFINASYDAFDDATEWDAQFFRSSTAFPASIFNEENLEVIPSDQCQVLESVIPDIDTESGIDMVDLSFIPESADAGEVITITSPAGTHATLDRQMQFGFFLYQTPDDVAVAGPIPAGLTADIPGAAGGFPALSNVPLPSAAPIEFTLDGTTINWTGSGESGASVNLFFAALTDGDVLNQTIIQCDLLDDGVHTIASGLLPEGTQEYPFFSGTRIVTLIQQMGGAVVVATAESDGFLGNN